MARSLTGTYLETKLAALVSGKLGGSAYHDGSPAAYPGTLGSDSLSPLARISNANKNEPSALFALQFHFPKLVNGGGGATIYVPLVNAVGQAGMPFPRPSGLTVVAADVAYAAQSAGTDATFYVSVSDGSAVFPAAVGVVPPATLKSLTISDGDLENDNSTLAVQASISAMTGGGPTDYVIDAVVTLICKSKHVA